MMTALVKQDLFLYELVARDLRGHKSIDVSKRHILSESNTFHLFGIFNIIEKQLEKLIYN